MWKPFILPTISIFFWHRWLLQFFVAAEELCGNCFRKRIAWFKLFDMLSEGGHLISLGVFGCGECCSCRFVFQIMNWDSCNMQRDFSSVFDGFVAFRVLCAALKFWVVLPLVTSSAHSCWSAGIEDCFVFLFLDFYSLFLSGLSGACFFSICIRGTGICLVRRAFCLWEPFFWRACFFFSVYVVVMVQFSWLFFSFWYIVRLLLLMLRLGLGR